MTAPAPVPAPGPAPVLGSERPAERLGARPDPAAPRHRDDLGVWRHVPPEAGA